MASDEPTLGERSAAPDDGPGARPVRSPPLPADGLPDAAAILEAVPDACVLVAPDGRITHANRAAADLLGTVPVGSPLAFKMRVPQLLEAFERAARAGTCENVRWREPVPTDRWFEAFVRPLGPAGAVASAGAVTHSAVPKGETGAGRAALTVARGVAVFVRDLTDQERAEIMRQDFIANASHELRTPLASLSGFIETIRGAARNDPAAQATFLEIMQQQADRMRRLIDDLLSLSRVEMHEHVRPRDVLDLGQLVRHAVDALKPLADRSDVELAFRSDGASHAVLGDRDELIQVFDNLIENAIKYGGAPGRVEVEVRLETAGEQPVVAASVRDHGRGIAPEHLPRLTERFYRVQEDDAGQKRGTGLGLAIVKHILSRHGGRLAIDSELGRGSVFTVRLGSVAVSSESMTVGKK